MHPAVQLRVEERRGCGFRKPGGVYLVSDGPSAPCGKLPIPLEICPTCGQGIKPARGWTWIHATALLASRECQSPDCSPRCPLAGSLGRAGLLWIGEAFYGRPEDWTAEARRLGVSRRISAVPRGFVVGQTWVLVAHRKAIRNPDDSWTAAIFHAFCPQRIEYVVRGDETDEQIEDLLKRGLTPVLVRRVQEQHELPLDAEAAEAEATEPAEPAI